MTEPVRCPDCGNLNSAESDFCSQCNHPLREGHLAEAAAAAPAAAADPAPGRTPPPVEPPVVIRRMRPIRPRRPRGAESQIVLQLWLVFGTICVLVVLWVAIQSNVKKAASPVEGSTEAQQARANELFQALASDSNNVDIHRQLGDILYDTANWSEAIVHYRAALRRDSSLVTALVDLGVCYYNLSQVNEAERHFMLALAREPHQSVALFNMGVVSEGRGQLEPALQYYHRAMQSNPPEGMRAPLQQRMDELMKKLGRPAPALPPGK